MPNNVLRHHLDHHDLFLGNNFLTILEYRDELQNEHQVYQFPFQKRWLQPPLQHLPSGTCLDVLHGFLHPNLRDTERH